ncbi:site-specific integrase [Salicibibacter cibi]
MYQKFINYLIDDKGFSKQTVRLTHRTMYMAIKRAVKPSKKIQANFCEDVIIDTPREKSEKNKVRFIDYDQIPAFLQTAKKDNLLYFMFFCHLIQTGMRKGEAGGLQWSQVDLSNQRINIIQSLDYSEDLDSPELFGDTKTYKSAREIPITNWWTMQLNSHRIRQNDNRMRFGKDYRHDLDLVFAREDGTPIPKSTLFNAFRRLCKKADLPTDLDIHSLRHTAAVLLLESEAEMKYIQDLLGHGSMQITADVYSHVSNRIERDSLNKFEDHTWDVFSS